MSNLYSKKEHAQFKGPLTSDNYNARIEALYKDLIFQSNKIGLAEEDVVRAYQRMVKLLFSAGQSLQDLEKRIIALENTKSTIVFTNSAADDTARFNSTAYAVPSSAKCHQDLQHGVLVLPKIDASSISRVNFLDNAGATIIPSTLEINVVPDKTTADSMAAVVDSSPVENAFLNKPGSIWERNVIVSNSNASGAVLSMYVRVPDEFSTTADVNAILVHPYPLMGCDLLGVYVSTKVDIVLNDSDNYTAINSSASHNADTKAVGWIAPGGWSGDTILNCGPKIFYFNPKTVTAIKLVLRQKNYFTDSGRFIYSYGLSAVDIRNDKFSNIGRAIIRYDVADGRTISSVSSVMPYIWNVSEAELSSVFSYRLIWETSFNSGVYTLTPVPLSKRVWIEVTLNSTDANGTPALSGLVLDGDFVNTDGNDFNGNIDGGIP